MSQSALTAEIDRLGPWFHNIHLPGGHQTAPDHFFGDFPMTKWRQIAPFLPKDLSGKTVLDIGCNAGFYSFELAARGADVLGIDMDDRYLEQARWVAQRKQLSDCTRFKKASVYEVGNLDAGQFDIVLFMGVFYHLRHPLLALDLIQSLEPELLVFQTLTHGDEVVSPFSWTETNFQTRDRLGERGWPSMAFIETTFAGDPTNWWVPNHAGVEAMLRSAGFTVTARPGHEIYVCNAAEAASRPYLDEAHQDARSIMSNAQGSQR
jgi:tRNA (mo5U34)-methyltransferase